MVELKLLSGGGEFSGVLGGYGQGGLTGLRSALQGDTGGKTRTTLAIEN